MNKLKKNLILILFIMQSFTFIIGSTQKTFPKNHIKNLIESKNKDNSIIYLEPGIYTEEYIKINNPLELIGEKDGSVLIYSQNFYQFICNSDLRIKNLNFITNRNNSLFHKNFCILTKDGDLIIENCSFSGFKTSITALSKGDLKISNSSFNYNDQGINIIKSRSFIKDCIFSNHGIVSILASNQDIQIVNSSFFSNRKAISIIPNSTNVYWKKQIKIESNKFSLNKTAVYIHKLARSNITPLCDLGGGGFSKGRNTFNQNYIDIELKGKMDIFAQNNFFELKEKNQIMKKVLLKKGSKIRL